MTNQDDIVISRAELPRVLVSFAGGETYFSLENSPYSRWAIGDNTARQTRKQAMDNLALADAIDCYLADDKKKAEAADEKKLRDEAAAFQKKFYPVNYAGLSDINEAYWMKVARIARELYGK